MLGLRARSTLCIGLLFIAAETVVDGQSLSGLPAKIEITGKPALTNNSGVTIVVELRDPKNRPAPAREATNIEVQGRTESGKVEKTIVTIKKGETAASLDLPIKEPGLLEVTATNPQLAQGGTLIEVRGERKIAPQPEKPSPSPPERRAFRLESRSRVAPPSSRHALRLERALPSLTASAALAAPPKEQQPRVPATSPAPYVSQSPELAPAVPATQPAAEELPTTNWNPVLKLRYYPTRTLRADETDPATIWASLQGDQAAPVDLQVYVGSELGPLNPDPIKIPKGDRIGSARLVSTHPGPVQVWYEWSQPSGRSPDKPFTINFGPPVWGLSVEPTVPRINLFESAEVAIEPVNSNKQAVGSDSQRDVYLSLVSGAGQIVSSQLTFQPKQGRVVTKFIPTWPGVVQFKARSDSLPDAFGTVTVTMPYLLIGLCALGSLLGGLVAYWAQQAATWQRIVIGLTTGFVLYWAFLFGVVHIPNFPNGVVTNPLSAVILPFIGGWAGTKVITLIVKQVGLQW
jgi:hypothetical protein